MILTRSPFYYTVTLPNTYVTAVDYEIIVGTGSTTTIVPLETYELTKPVPSDDSTKSWIDIAPFIRDFFVFAPIDFTGVSAAVIGTSGSQAVLLTQITASYIDTIGSNEDPDSNKYIVTDGYGYYTDGVNLQPSDKILLSQDNYKADSRGYFLVPLRAASGDSDPTVDGNAVTLSFSDANTNYVKYIKIPVSDYADPFVVSFGGDSITIEPVDECKFDLCEIQFLNRLGALEVIHFYKAKKESLDLKRETFKNNYYNGTSFDTAKHQIQQFNVHSNKKIKIETGFLNEDYNATIQELLQSEKVWMNGNPINVVSNSLEFKTRLIDKLISYSIDFEYAYDEINNV
jgi:hypothetical protein